MQLQRRKTLIYKGKQYYQYVFSIPNDQIEYLGWKHQQELFTTVRRGKLIVQKVWLLLSPSCNIGFISQMPSIFVFIQFWNKKMNFSKFISTTLVWYISDFKISWFVHPHLLAKSNCWSISYVFSYVIFFRLIIFIW